MFRNTKTANLSPEMNAIILKKDKSNSCEMWHHWQTKKQKTKKNAFTTTHAHIQIFIQQFQYITSKESQKLSIWWLCSKVHLFLGALFLGIERAKSNNGKLHIFTNRFIFVTIKINYKAFTKRIKNQRNIFTQITLMQCDPVIVVVLLLLSIGTFFYPFLSFFVLETKLV